jgi:hypothetical protein
MEKQVQSSGGEEEGVKAQRLKGVMAHRPKGAKVYFSQK